MDSIMFEEIQRLVRIVGLERFHEIHRHIWDTRAPILLAASNWPTDPYPLVPLWREVLEALRLELTH